MGTFFKPKIVSHVLSFVSLQKSPLYNTDSLFFYSIQFSFSSLCELFDIEFVLEQYQNL